MRRLGVFGTQFFALHPAVPQCGTKAANAAKIWGNAKLLVREMSKTIWHDKTQPAEALKARLLSLAFFASLSKLPRQR